MSNHLPPRLQDAVNAILARRSGSHREGASRLSETYRKGGSASADFGAYLVARLPATYAAVITALSELRRLAPEFDPRSVLDVGAGPGTASWAAREMWPGLEVFTFADNSEAFLALARELWAAPAAFLALDLRNANELPKAGLVIAAYTLAEISETEIVGVAPKLWQAAEQCLVIVEPGTPSGFARIRKARSELIGQGAFIVAPCPHHEVCPIIDPDWCHFSVRLPRSRAHKHAKKASMPFEDEKFAYLIVSRTPVDRVTARVLAPPRVSKAGVALKLCMAQGLEHRTVARRDSAAYKQAKKLGWGGII